MEPTEFEKIILKLLFQNVDVRDKVMPYLDPKIFDDFDNKELVKFILSFEKKFNKFPSVSDMKLHVDKAPVYDKLVALLSIDISEYNIESLLGEVESFFKKKLIWNVVADTVDNLKEDKLDKIIASPDIMREAIAFSFNTKIGMDLLDEAERFYNHLHDTGNKIVPTGWNNYDSTIQGGLHSKTLVLYLASTGAGKSLIMCSMATNMILQNRNVLYITLEMSEEKISERIIQNMFDLEYEQLISLTKDKFISKFADLKKKISSKLIINEYPTKGANCNSYRNLLKELKLKKKFIPDVIFVDYVGIMKPNYLIKSDNSYTEGKRVAEELRGLAVEYNVPLVSALQTNREGIDSMDITLKEISDSIGGAYTADILTCIMQNEELKQAGKMQFKNNKNRFGIAGQTFYVNVDYKKMRITDNNAEKEKVEALKQVQEAAVEYAKSELIKASQNKSIIFE